MIAADATNALMERWITAAILHEQQKDSQDRLVDHDRRLDIAGIVTQMRQAEAAESVRQVLSDIDLSLSSIVNALPAVIPQMERIVSELECVTEQITATWQNVSDISGQLEILASVASAWEDRVTTPASVSAYEDTGIEGF